MDEKILAFRFGRLLLGGILVCLIGGICYFATLFIAFLYSDSTGNAIFLVDRGLYHKVATVVIAFVFSVVYFYRQLSRQNWMIFHGLALIVFLTYFAVEFHRLRIDQQQILSQYQELREAIYSNDYERAYKLTSSRYPDSRTIEDIKRRFSSQKFAAIDTIYAVYIINMGNGEEAFIPTEFDDRKEPSRWYRRSYGPRALFYEKIDSEWKFVSEAPIGFMLD